jgi:hypothetical protein
LVGIRLLRNIPLAYLVPDDALLPPESIRFFHVDTTWVDRVVEGILAAASTGSVEIVYACAMLKLIRDAVDAALVDMAVESVPTTTWTPVKPMTGMLIRSELARRWPKMIVRAYETDNTSKPIAVLRAEPISQDIFIALFAGTPQLVHVREPNVGVRFGVEPALAPTPSHPYEVDGRTLDGGNTGGRIKVQFRNVTLRVLDMAPFANLAVNPKDARQVAINLDQRAYVQVFKSHLEPRGSKPLTAYPGNEIKLRKDRYMRLESLAARQKQSTALESK